MIFVVVTGGFSDFLWKLGKVWAKFMSQFYETKDQTSYVFSQAPFDRLGDESLGVNK